MLWTLWFFVYLGAYVCLLAVLGLLGFWLQTFAPDPGIDRFFSAVAFVISPFSFLGELLLPFLDFWSGILGVVASALFWWIVIVGVHLGRHRLANKKTRT